MMPSVAPADNESFSDDELLATLDAAHKWELHTDDANFDTHYHTLREALKHVHQMTETDVTINAASTLDGAVYVDHAQLIRLLDAVGFAASRH